MSEWLFRYTLLSAVSGCFISNLSFEKFILNVPLVNKAVENFFYEIANCSIPFEQTHVVSLVGLQLRQLLTQNFLV